MERGDRSRHYQRQARNGAKEYISLSPNMSDKSIAGGAVKN